MATTKKQPASSKKKPIKDEIIDDRNNKPIKVTREDLLKSSKSNGVTPSMAEQTKAISDFYLKGKNTSGN